MKQSDLAKALVITAEVMGHELTPTAAAAMARELSACEPQSVSNALRRCQRELSGRLSLAAVLARLEDGRLGSEEAWALAFQAADENATIVWTEEISESYRVAGRLLAAGDKVAARLAFREHYEAAVRRARDSHQPLRWTVSLGHDPGLRGAAVLHAVEMGRLTAGEASKYVAGLPDVGDKLARLACGEPQTVGALLPESLDSLRGGG